MNASTASARIDEYIATSEAWAKPILKKLRATIRKADKRLEEAVKWGAPHYVLGGIVCSFHAFKEYVGMWFPKGELLKDPAKILIKSDAKHMRGLRFATLADIDEKTLLAYVREAVALEDAGVKVKKAPVVVEVPSILAAALARNPKARKTFDSLAPSCRREYASYIAEAKKPETQERRLEKSLELLLEGKDLHAKYKK